MRSLRSCFDADDELENQGKHHADVCGTALYGDRLYKGGQKRFGRLEARPMDRLPAQAQMLKWLHDAGIAVEGMRLFEVGTGHVPLVPIGFYLCGAEQVITVDLHRRIDRDLTRDSLRWISAHRKDVWALYDGLVSEGVFNDRFAVLSQLVHDPQRFLNEAGIDYKAPTNAADTGLPCRGGRGRVTSYSTLFGQK